MTIRVLCIGRLKHRFIKDACDEYAGRLSRFAKVEILELPDEKAPESLSPAQKERIKQAEGARLIGKMEGYAIALCIEGAVCTSEMFAQKLADIARTSSRLTFVIGGSLGLSGEVKAHANECMSFSSLTFSHQLFRVMLLEQLYRTHKINANQTYHK